MNKHIILILLSLIVLAHSPKNVYAGIGVSPSEIIVEAIKPGSSVIKSITISSSDLNQYNALKVENAYHGSDNNEQVIIEPNESFFTLDENTKNIDISISISENASEQSYEKIIIVKPNITDDDNDSGVTITPAISIPIKINVTNSDIKNLIVRSIEFIEYDSGENIKLNVSLENNGNVDSKLDSATLNLSNLDGLEIKSFTTSNIESIPAGVQKNIIVEWDNSHNLPPDEYFANVDLYFNEDILYTDKIYLRHENFKSEVTKPESDNNIISHEVDNKEVGKLLILVVIGVFIVISLMIHKKYSKQSPKID